MRKRNQGPGRIRVDSRETGGRWLSGALAGRKRIFSSSFPLVMNEQTERRLCGCRNPARYNCNQVCGGSRHIEPLVYTALRGCCSSDTTHGSPSLSLSAFSAALSSRPRSLASDSRAFQTWKNARRGYCRPAPRPVRVPVPSFRAIIHPILGNLAERLC